MGIPVDAPAAADPYAAVYPTMAPKQAPPAPKASVLPPAATETTSSLDDLYPTMKAKLAQATQQPATGASPAVAGPQAVADEIDPGTVAAAQALAKELNLPSEQAAKVLAHHKALAAADAARWTAETETWSQQVRDDPEIGGANLDASMGAARALLKEYAPPELLKDLATTGYGSHPGLVRFVARVAKAMGTRAGQNQIAALYHSMPNP